MLPLQFVGIPGATELIIILLILVLLALPVVLASLAVVFLVLRRRDDGEPTAERAEPAAEGTIGATPERERDTESEQEAGTERGRE